MATNPFAAFFDSPQWKAQNAERAAKLKAQYGPPQKPVDAGFNTKPTKPGNRMPANPGGASYDLKTWEPNNKPTYAPKPPSPVGTPIGGGTAKLTPGGQKAVKPGTPHVVVGSTPAAPSGQKTVAQLEAEYQAKLKQQQPSAMGRQAAQLRQQGWGGQQPAQQRPFNPKFGGPQAAPPPQGWGGGQNPNQMYFNSGHQQSPYPTQQPPWMQQQQQPQWGGMSSHYNSMNPWAQMPNYQPQRPQMPGYGMQQPSMNYNNAFQQFGQQWQSPFANRPMPSYQGPSQMPVMPNLPTQQPQYVQTPWG